MLQKSAVRRTVRRLQRGERVLRGWRAQRYIGITLVRLNRADVLLKCTPHFILSLR